MILWRYSLCGLGVFFGMVGYLFSLVSLLRGTGDLLECALWRYSSSLLTEWRLPVVFDVEGASGRDSEEPDV